MVVCHNPSHSFTARIGFEAVYKDVAPSSLVRVFDDFGLELSSFDECADAEQVQIVVSGGEVCISVRLFPWLMTIEACIQRHQLISATMLRGTITLNNQRRGVVLRVNRTGLPNIQYIIDTRNILLYLIWCS